MSFDKRWWIEENKEHLVCEPSGRTYAQLLEDRIRKIMIVESDIDQLMEMRRKQKDD